MNHVNTHKQDKQNKMHVWKYMLRENNTIIRWDQLLKCTDSVFKQKLHYQKNTVYRFQMNKQNEL